MPVNPIFSRELAGQQVFTLEGRVAYTDSGTKILGSLPGGARILDVFCDVETLIDGTPTLLLGNQASALGGISADTDSIMASADIAPGTAGRKKMVAATLAAGALWPRVKKVPTDNGGVVNIITTLSFGGSPSQGAVNFVITYTVPNQPTWWGL